MNIPGDQSSTAETQAERSLELVEDPSLLMPTSSRLDRTLAASRKELLDLTARNRLLSTPLGSSRSTRLDIESESSNHVFEVLVANRKEMSFLPVNDADEESVVSPKKPPVQRSQSLFAAQDEDANDEELGEEPPAEQIDPDDTTHNEETDRTLQTALGLEKLQTRLLRTFYDARSMFEEQGVNSLFLALGFLEWYESPTSGKQRFAPLLLIPVELHRRTINARFRLKALEEELTENLSLQAKLQAEFGMKLPELPDEEDLVPSEYFAAIEAMIADQPRWKVHRNRMTLWFFSFAKFLMYRDLNPDLWPAGRGPVQHQVVQGLLGEPTLFEPAMFPDDAALDSILDPHHLCHVLDADSSQTAAIQEVRVGRHLVVQGPPGTGKSQSIVNVIASAVRDGKTVLFMAEKLAALQVVKSRFDQIGLGDICLELHSHRANRRTVLEDLGRTLELGRPANQQTELQAEDLKRTRDRLNSYVNQLHQAIEPTSRTPFQLIGRISRLQSEGIQPLPCALPDPLLWSPTTLREKQALLRNIGTHLGELGVPQQHPLWGVSRTEALIPSDQQAVHTRLAQLSGLFDQVLAQAKSLASQLNVAWDGERESFRTLERLTKLAQQLRTIPELDRTAFVDNVWESQRNRIDAAIERGRQLLQCRLALTDKVSQGAWDKDPTLLRSNLAATGHSWFRVMNGT